MPKKPVKALPPARLLRRILSYNPETGDLRWKPRAAELFKGRPKDAARHAAIWNGRFAGENPALKAGARYLRVTIYASTYYAHRLIWKMVHGEEPETIDHINGDGFDNRLANLRNVSLAENNRNIRIGTNNSSGHIGVYQPSWTTKWAARYANVHLGCFDTFEAAVAARTKEEARRGFTARLGADQPLSVSSATAEAPQAGACSPGS